MSKKSTYGNKAFLKKELMKLEWFSKHNKVELSNLTEQITGCLEINDYPKNQFLFHFDEEKSLGWWVILYGGAQCYQSKSIQEKGKEKILYKRRREIENEIGDTREKLGEASSRFSERMKQLERMRVQIEKDISKISSAKYDNLFQGFGDRYYTFDKVVLDCKFQKKIGAGSVIYCENTIQRFTIYLDKDCIIGFLNRNKYMQILEATTNYQREVLVKALKRLETKHNSLIHLKEMKSTRPLTAANKSNYDQQQEKNQLEKEEEEEEEDEIPKEKEGIEKNGKNTQGYFVEFHNKRNSLEDIEKGGFEESLVKSVSQILKLEEQKSRSASPRKESPSNRKQMEFSPSKKSLIAGDGEKDLQKRIKTLKDEPQNYQQKKRFSSYSNLFIPNSQFKDGGRDRQQEGEDNNNLEQNNSFYQQNDLELEAKASALVQSFMKRKNSSQDASPQASGISLSQMSQSIQIVEQGDKSKENFCLKKS